MGNSFVPSRRTAWRLRLITWWAIWAVACGFGRFGQMMTGSTGRFGIP